MPVIWYSYFKSFETALFKVMSLNIYFKSHFRSIKNNSANFLVTKKIDKIAIKHEKTTIRALDTIGQSMFQPIYENLRNA